MRKHPLSLLLLGALLLGACSTSKFGSSYFAPTAALVCGGVNCVKISESKIAEQLSTVLADPQTAKPFVGPGGAASRVAAQREILSNLIRDEVALQKARRMNITVSRVQPEADAALKELQAGFPSKAAFNAQLKREGLTLGRLKTILVQEAMLKRVQAEVGKGSEATAAEIEQFYNQNKSQYDEQVNISHILICGNLDAQKRTCNPSPEDATKAADVLKRARAGEDFGALAREFSADVSTKDKGGEIGFVSRGDLVPEVEQAAFGLQAPGEISEPVKSQFGLHIVKLNKVGKPLEVARVDIEQGLTRRKLTKAFDEWLIGAIRASTIKVNNRIGTYDPISQKVVALEPKGQPAPQVPVAPQSTDAPQVPDPAQAPQEGAAPGASSAPEAPAP